MFTTHKLIGIVILAMAMPICLLAKPTQDTAVYFSDSHGKAVKAGRSSFFAMQWKEGDFWHVRNYSYPEKILQLDGYFDDQDCKKKEKLLIRYYSNGMMQDSGQYVSGKEEGMHYGWHETGEPSFITHYKSGMFIDTSIGWYKNGTKSMLTVANKYGTGMQEEYHDNGKIATSGHFVAGKKNGIWVFTDNNQIISQEVVYEGDSALLVNNYNEKGVKEEGSKEVEIPATFPGGLNGWRRFLERNLQYPEAAQRKGAQGVIRVSLIVDKDGKVTNTSILGDPDKDLAKEALRMMSISPKWIPAVQHNRKVTYRFVQTITFSVAVSLYFLQSSKLLKPTLQHEENNQIIGYYYFNTSYAPLFNGKNFTGYNNCLL